jgi:hypothetical protein
MTATFLGFSALASPLMPDLVMTSAGRHLGWACLLSAFTLFFLRSTPVGWRFGLGLCAFIISILPTQWGATYWLGLAFQTPSLVAQGLCLLYIGRAWRHRYQPHTEAVIFGEHARWPVSVLLCTIALGWLLALDTFAMLPIELFALGYAPTTALLGLAMAGFFWLLAGRDTRPATAQKKRDIAIVLVASVAIHLLTRLPDGNVWNALMDPWLWLVAQFRLLSWFLVYLFFRLRLGLQSRERRFEKRL